MPEPFTNALSSPDVGTTLAGKYRVVRRIGEGGMGVVVEAENLLTGKRVAIKWMHPEVAGRPDAVARFLREARASARVRHPNVVDVYDAVHDRDTCFLVMELLEGESLGFALERGGMPAHELIGYLLDAMRGVLAAHRQGVIHRDIKPDNIFLTLHPDRAHRVPKVLDFGVSKVAGLEALALTRTGAAMGTPMYMSYEQLSGVKDIDVRTDVYAFGVVLYEALTGVPPYAARNLPQLVAKMAHTMPSPARQLRPDIPEALDALIQRAMAKDREQRFGSLDELIAALEPFASPAAFRAPVVPASRVLPRVKPVAPVPVESLMLTERTLTWAPTPMEASVPIPAVPRRHDALPWLVLVGVIATLIGVLTAYRSLVPEAEDSGEQDGAPAAAIGGGTEPSAAKSVEAPVTDMKAATKAPAPDVKAGSGVKPATDARTAAEAAQQPGRVTAEPAAPHASAVAKPPARPAAPLKAVLPPGIVESKEASVIERPITRPSAAPVAEPAEGAPPTPAPAPAREDR
jgi:serine/threonine-protein kinase